MSVNSGGVSVPAYSSSGTPTLIYQTPDGVVTTLVVAVPAGIIIGGASVTYGEGVEPGSVITLSGFTGSLYAISNTETAETVTYVAADIQ
jgi:hypothetical protein